MGDISQPFTPYLSQQFSYDTNHALQTLHLILPHPLSSTSESQIFLIYIHGGAWRDPSQSSSDFAPATTLILADPALRAKVAGIASLNYGLSAYPSDPSSDPSRNYKHPQHIRDVALALNWLQEHYNFGGKDDGWRYVLVGHSCGATMALQVAAALDSSAHELFGKMQRPCAIVGVEGIYDLSLLVRNHATIPIYREFVVGAFGEDEAVWRNVSPVHFNAQQLKGLVGDGRLVVVAHSSEDELVEQEQADAMTKALQRVGVSGENVKSVSLRGTHDEVWQRGHELLKAIDIALCALVTDTKSMKDQQLSGHA